MSSKPSNALDRLVNRGVDAIFESFDEVPSQIVVHGHDIVAIALAAVLPALADEISQHPDLFQPEGSAVAGWLRSLAAPADDPKP
jgi:hypothetical protein